MHHPLNSGSRTSRKAIQWNILRHAKVPPRSGYGIAMGVPRRMPEQRIEPIEHAWRQCVLKPLRLDMHFSPIKPDVPNEEAFDDAMTAKDIERLATPQRRQRHAPVPRRTKQSSPCKSLHHRRHCPLGQTQFLCETRHAHFALPAQCLDSLEVVLHRLRDHG